MFIVLAVVVSGCSALPSGNSSPGQSSPEMLPGKGLEITGFTVSDNTLRPGQEVSVTLDLKNYHRKEVEHMNVSLYNLGLLEKSDKSCTPDEIEPAKENGINPVMECTWSIKAPSSDVVGGFEQRKSSITANVEFSTSMENFQPMKVNFKPLSEINRTDKKSMTFSNGEVKVNMQTETPVPLNQNKTINFRVEKAGSGRIDGDYSFQYDPSSVFVDASDYGDPDVSDNQFECPQSDKPVLENTLDFSCYINENSPGEVVRNLFFTVSYKYVQTESLDITIVR